MLFMKKKVIIFLIIILFSLIISGGFFWWWQNKNKEIKGKPTDYIIKETKEGKFVENKKAGLKIKPPKGWKIERVEVEEGAINFYSPDIEINQIEGKIVLPLKKGCLIQSTVIYKKMNFDQIKEEVRYTHFRLDIKSEEFEEIIVNNFPALKNSFDTQKIGPGLGVYISKKDKGYAFYLHWSGNNQEKCNQEFDKFLETILIK